MTTTPETTPEIPAVHQTVLKGIISNALAEHGGAVDAPTRIAATVAGALAELGYGTLLAELDRTRAERDALARRVAELERRDVTSALAVIAKHGDMSETVRREIRDLLDDVEADDGQ